MINSFLNISKKKLIISQFFLIVILIFGCSRFKTNPLEIPVYGININKLILFIKNYNSTIKNFKGLGKFYTSSFGNKIIKERIAFIADLPERLRVEVLGPFGAVMRFAINEETIFFSSVNDSKIYKKKNSKWILKRFIPVLINTEDLLMFICSRIPIYKYSASTLRKKDNEYVLILKKRFGKCQKIYLDKKMEQILKVELYDTFNRFLYKVQFNKMKKIDNYNIYQNIIISDKNNSSFHLDINKIYLNTSISKSQFILQ